MKTPKLADLLADFPADAVRKEMRKVKAGIVRVDFGDLEAQGHGDFMAAWKARLDLERERYRYTPNPTEGENRKARRTKTKAGDKTYVVLRSNNARNGTWRCHMLRCILNAKSTGEARKAHADSGLFRNERLNFNWAANNGFIKWDS